MTITDNPPTPTPWAVRETKQPEPARRWWFEILADNTVVGEIYTTDGDDEGERCIDNDEARANAALIVRAVNSFEVLVEALRLLRTQALQSPDLRSTAWGQEALDYAHAVLAKAEAR